MIVNLSYLEVPIDFQLKRWDSSKLKDNMFLTAEPLYQDERVEFEDLINIVKSDYRQYSPFNFSDGIKKSENWSNDNQNLIILDVDEGLTLNEAMNIFKDYEYLIATTKSHKKDKKGLICDRFRIILVSEDIPKGDAYFEFTTMLEKKYTFIDKQVNTKTGAFLGAFNCNHYYNKGKLYNCSEVIECFNRLKKAQYNHSESNREVPTRQNYSNLDDLPIQQIKDLLDRELVADIIRDCGFDVNRKFMFRYRKNERTPSASISPQLLVKDFGSDLSTDVIGFVQQVKGVDFKTALEIVGGYVNVSFA